MKVADRLSRIVVIFTLVSFISFSLKFLLRIYSISFSNIYLGKLLISEEQLLAIALIVNTIIILYFLFNYCYYEMQAFYNIKETKLKHELEEKIDEQYTKIFKVMSFCLKLSLFIFLLRSFILPLLLYLIELDFIKDFRFIIFIIILIIINLFIFYIEKNDKTSYKLKKILEKRLYFILFLVWIISALLLSSIGITQFSNPILQINFIESNNKKNPEISFKFTDRISNKMPNKIELLIITNTNNSESKINLSPSDFFKTFTEINVNKNQKSLLDNYFKNDEKFFDINKSNVSLYKKIELPKIKDSGSLIITFDENNPLENKKFYKIVNDFYIENNKLHFNEPSIKVNLK